MSWRKARKAVALLTAGALILTSAGIKADAAKAAVKLNKTKVSLAEGKKVSLKISKTNVKTIKSKKWTTTKPSIAAVSSSGKVTAKKAGNATIKCVVKYIAKGAESVSKKTLKCKVTVTSSKEAETTAAPSVVAPTTEAPASDAPAVEVPSAEPGASSAPATAEVTAGVTSVPFILPSGVPLGVPTAEATTEPQATSTPAAEATEAPEGTAEPAAISLPISSEWTSGWNSSLAVDASAFTKYRNELTGKNLVITFSQDTNFGAYAGADEYNGGATLREKSWSSDASDSIEITTAIAMQLLNGGLYIA